MTSIQEKIRRLTELNQKKSLLTKDMRKLNKEIKTVNQDVVDYLTAKEQPGVKYDGTAIILDTKPKPVAKPKKLKEQSYIEVLQRFGIDNPQEVLKELFESGKESKEITKLKLKKIK
jgi:hypothetical protein